MNRLAHTALLALAAATAAQQDDTLPDGELLFSAMQTELQRSLGLQMEDLESPYFVRYAVNDSVGYSVSAAWGTLGSSGRNRSRSLAVRVRIGSHELDNTNFSGGAGGFSFGGGSGLPVDDDLLALRHALWTATDASYKSAVQTLTSKRAYMKDKTIEDRPADFTPAPVVTELAPLAQLAFDRAGWEQRCQALSGRFLAHPSIQDSSVSLSVSASNRFYLDSDGIRLRTPDVSATLRISASTQASDGYRLRDGFEYFALAAAELPPVETVLADIDALVQRLQDVGAAARIDGYTGPVLFTGTAAPAVLRAMLAGGLASNPDVIGRGRAADTLEKKLGQRILPRSFVAFDDPGIGRLGDVALAGHYAFDDEGVAARRVGLVEGGKLLATVLGRSPTRRQSGSTGHGRGRGSFATPAATIGNLFVEDTAGVPESELLDELRSAANDEGLEHGLLVESFGDTRRLSSGSGVGQVRLPDPLVVYKVSVADGSKELLQLLQFTAADAKTLRRVLVAGDRPYVHNVTGPGGSAVVAPSLLFEELELTKIEQELDKLPLLQGPLQRE